MEEKLGKYFADESSEAECQEILEWRAASEENAKTFFEYKTIWATSQEKSYQPQGTIEDLIPETNVRPIVTNSWMKYAAGIVLVLGAAITIFLLFEETGPSVTRMVELEDGTEVTLYKDASLTVLEHTEGKHVVTLTGKAYFDVVPNSGREFVILTDEAKVEVVGTSFQVNCIEKNTTEVIVESGVVSFSQNPETYRGKLTPISLKAGEKGLISPSAKGIVKQNNRNKNYLAWANQVLIFQGEEMGEVAKLISEVYGIEVEFENAVIQNCRLTANYKKKSPRQLAKLISKTFGFSYTLEEDRIVFAGAGC